MDTLSSEARPETNHLPNEGELVTWLHKRNDFCDMQVNEISWRMSREWIFDQGRFRHRTGGFFSVVKATVSRQGQHIPSLDQLLIDQPEIGILGFVLRDGAKGKEILVQGKPEPGNVNLVQAAPTVQATESNYKRRHLGKSTPCLEFFLGGSKAKMLSNCLQSEQGTRFIGKYNRNMMVQVSPTFVLKDNFSLRWFSVGALLALLKEDFQINTDARSVLTTSPWEYLAENRRPFSRWCGQDEIGEMLWCSYTNSGKTSVLSQQEIVGRLLDVRNGHPFSIETVRLADLPCQEILEPSSNIETNLLSIRHYDVSTTEREIKHWDQPMFSCAQEGLIVLFCQINNGVLHFLFNCLTEIGFREGFQCGPTIQVLGDDAFIFPELGAQEYRLKEQLTRAQIRISGYIRVSQLTNCADEAVS